jgi:hypothetical protein
VLRVLAMFSHFCTTGGFGASICLTISADFVGFKFYEIGAAGAAR